jgi:hypothetical protein
VREWRFIHTPDRTKFGSSGFSYGSFPMMNRLNASAGACFGPDSSRRQFCAIADSRHFRSQIDIRSGQNRSLVCNKRASPQAFDSVANQSVSMAEIHCPVGLGDINKHPRQRWKCA